MINVTLEQIKNWIDCEIDEKHLKTINGVSIDSRKSMKGRYLYLLKVRMLMAIVLSHKL